MKIFVDRLLMHIICMYICIYTVNPEKVVQAKYTIIYIYVDHVVTVTYASTRDDFIMRVNCAFD